MKRKTIFYAGLCAWVLLTNAVAAKAQTNFDPTTLSEGQSKVVYIAVAGAAETTVISREGLTQDKAFLKGVPYSEATSVESPVIWKVTRKGTLNAAPLYKFSDVKETCVIDENAKFRMPISNYSSDWHDRKLIPADQAETYYIGEGKSGGASYWLYELANERTAQGNASNRSAFYFIEYAGGPATEEDRAGLSEAISAANEVLDQMERIGIAQTADAEPGKYHKLSYEALKHLVDEATTLFHNPAVLDVEIASMIGAFNLDYYRTQFSWDAAVFPQGWYRLRDKTTHSYYDCTGTFSEKELKNDGSQYFYLRNMSDVPTRYEMYSFDALRSGKETKVGSYGNSNHFQLHDCGELGVILRSGGNGTRWSGLNNENVPTTSTASFYLGDGTCLFLDLEPLSARETAAVSLPDGEYALSFNGVPIPDENTLYTVTGGKIAVGDTEYQIRSYGDLNYSIGDEKVATLKADLSEYKYQVNKGNPLYAVPFPGFRLTPSFREEEVLVSGLTHFGRGDLTGKTVKVTGTVDFANLEMAGAENMQLVDNQPFRAYNAVLLRTPVSYTRCFNKNADGEYSTVATPRWEAICVPFEVETVTGECPVRYGEWTGGSRALKPDVDYWLYELTGTGFVRNKEGIQANKPYIIAFPYSWVPGDASSSYAPELNVSGDVIFSGSSLAATTDEKQIGNEFSLVSTFEHVAVGEEVYVLDESGAYFENSVAPASPFRPYVVLPESGNAAGPSRIYIGGEEPTGLSPLPSMSASVQIERVSGGVSIRCQEPRVVTIYTLAGSVLGRVNVQPGTQVLTLPVGVFVIEGEKVVVTE